MLNDVLVYELVREEDLINDFKELPLEMLTHLMSIKSSLVLKWLVDKPKMVDNLGWKTIAEHGYLPCELTAQMPPEWMVKYPDQNISRYDELSDDLKKTFIHQMSQVSRFYFEKDFKKKLLIECLEKKWFSEILLLEKHGLIDKSTLVETITTSVFKDASEIIDSLNEFEGMTDILCVFAVYLSKIKNEKHSIQDDPLVQNMTSLITNKMAVLSAERQCHLIRTNGDLLRFSDISSFSEQNINYLAYLNKDLSTLLTEDMFGVVARKNAIHSFPSQWIDNGFSLTDEEQLYIIERGLDFLKVAEKYTVNKATLLAGLSRIFDGNLYYHEYKHDDLCRAISVELINDVEVQTILVAIRPNNILSLKNPNIQTWIRAINSAPRLIEKHKGFPHDIPEALWKALIKVSPPYILKHPMQTQFDVGEVSRVDYYHFISTIMVFAPSIILYLKNPTDNMLSDAIDIMPSLMWTVPLRDLQTPELVRASVLAEPGVLWTLANVKCPVLRFHPDIGALLDKLVADGFAPSHIKDYQGDIRVEIAKRDIRVVRFMDGMKSDEALVLLPYAKTENQKFHLMHIISL